MSRWKPARSSNILQSLNFIWVTPEQKFCGFKMLTAMFSCIRTLIWESYVKSSERGENSNYYLGSNILIVCFMLPGNLLIKWPIKFKPNRRSQWACTATWEYLTLFFRMIITCCTKTLFYSVFSRHAQYMTPKSWPVLSNVSCLNAQHNVKIF